MAGTPSPLPGADQPPYDVVVLTTAALPWRTGPAYLSLWHAAGLAELGLRVAYGIPWLPPASQRRLWGEVRFSAPEEQYTWLAEEARRLGCPPPPTLFHYRGYYAAPLRSIVPLEEVFAAAPPARVVVLEEPEHLCWFPRTRPRHRLAAARVVGLLLTNYDYYVRQGVWPGLRWLGRVVDRFHRRLMRRHTDLLVPLSPAVAPAGLDHPQVEARITGVLAPYVRVAPVTDATRGVYFLGRLVWAKGLDQLIEIARRTGLTVDLYGDGPDAEAIARRARRRGATLRLLGPSAEPWTLLHRYRVFLNPSLSEVLCTATADALVAGRHAVLPECPANRPFLGYPNAHGYRDLDGAVAALRKTLEHPPLPPTAVRRDFDWRNACRNLAALWADQNHAQDHPTQERQP